MGHQVAGAQRASGGRGQDLADRGPEDLVPGSDRRQGGGPEFAPDQAAQPGEDHEGAVADEHLFRPGRGQRGLDDGEVAGDGKPVRSGDEVDLTGAGGECGHG